MRLGGRPAASMAADKQQSCWSKSAERTRALFSASISSCCLRECIFMCALHHMWLLHCYNQHSSLMKESVKGARQDGGREGGVGGVNTEGGWTEHRGKWERKGEKQTAKGIWRGQGGYTKCFLVISWLAWRLKHFSCLQHLVYELRQRERFINVTDWGHFRLKQPCFASGMDRRYHYRAGNYRQWPITHPDNSHDNFRKPAKNPSINRLSNTTPPFPLLPKSLSLFSHLVLLSNIGLSPL